MTQPREFSVKARCFQEGELDDGWTIVASRKTKRSSKTETESEEQTAEEPGTKPAMPPKKWPRSLILSLTDICDVVVCQRSILALGAAAAVGLASFLVSRRLRRNEAA